MTDKINFADDGVVDINDLGISPENSVAVEKNREWIKKAYAEEFEVVAKDDNEGGARPAWRRYNADVLDKIKFVDEDGQENQKVRENCENTIWEIAKNEVLRDLAFDFGFMKLKEERKLMLLRAELSDAVAKTALGVVGITPVIKRQLDGEVAAEELAKADAKLSIQALDKYLSDKGTESAEVSKSAVIGAALCESEKMDDFVSYIEKKNYSANVVNGFKADNKDFGKKMKSFFGKAWTSAKEYIANNRARVITDTVATVATSAAFLSGVGLAAVGAYAAYTAIGSAVWPIEEKRRKMYRRAKMEGREYKDYKFGMSFKALSRAWKDIKSDEKEWKRYKNRAKTGIAAGVLVAGGLGALGTGLVTGVDALAARVGGTITRSFAAVTAQGLNFKDTRKDLKLEDSAENRAAYKSAKWGLGIGLTVATLTSALGVYNLWSSHLDAEAQAEEAAQKAAKKAVKKTVKVAKKVVEEKPVAEVEIPYPPVWSEESGISQKHFEEIYGKFDADGKWHAGKITGILSRQNQAFDEWNEAHPDDLRQIEVKDPGAMYKDMMKNLSAARKDNPELFAGKTDDQVIYQYIKNVEYSEKVKNGPVVNGVKTLITRVGSDKLPLYASNQDEMQALFKMLRCGEKVEVSAAALNATLDRIDLKTGQGIGKEFSALITNNSFWGYGPDCDNGVSMWRKGLNAVKRVFSKEPEVKTVESQELITEDVEVKSAQVTDAQVRSAQFRDLEGVDADAQAVYTTPKIIMGRGTSDKFDNDLTDPVAQQTKKVGSSINVDKATRKLEGVRWTNPKSNGGNGM